MSFDGCALACLVTDEKASAVFFLKRVYFLKDIYVCIYIRYVTMDKGNVYLAI